MFLGLLFVLHFCLSLYVSAACLLRESSRQEPVGFHTRYRGVIVGGSSEEGGEFVPRVPELPTVRAELSTGNDSVPGKVRTRVSDRKVSIQHQEQSRRHIDIT